jgi:hypothetical protein
VLGLGPDSLRRSATPIIVGDKNRDWGSLARKLGNGVPLERAANETGIPYEEATEWAAKRASEPDFLDLMMRCAAGEAIETAVRTLKNLANDDKATREVRAMAAGDLAKLAVQILTKTQTGGVKAPGGKKDEGQPDLFDGAAKDMGPWKLTMIK